MFRNPHAWVHVMASDVDGDSFVAGDHVIIRGNPGRNPADHRLRMRSLLRPADGFGWGFEGESFD